MTTKEEQIRNAKKKYGESAVLDGLEAGWEAIELERGYIHTTIKINELVCLKDFALENKVGAMEITILDNMDDFAGWVGLDTSLDALLERAKLYNEDLLPELYSELVRFMNDEDGDIQTNNNPTFMPIKNSANLEILENLKKIRIE